MAIDTRHPQYDARAEQWRRIRDVLEGGDAIKGRGTRYLPRLEGQSENPVADDGYNAYLARAEFHEASGRTLDGLTGAIFRKPPAVEVPEGQRKLLDNIDGAGVPFDQFAKAATAEIIAMGRYGVLVDAPSHGGGAPFLRGYAAESILNWRTTEVAGVPVLSLVVLAEAAEHADADNPFATVTRQRFRLLQLAPREGGGPPVYSVTLFDEQVGARGEPRIAPTGEPVIPVRRGRPFDFIPFQFIGPRTLSAAVERSPILGLVDVNLSHYRSSADIEHGAHFTALPTPWVAGGIQSDAGELRIGSGTAWHLAEGARAGMLEYTGQGLQALERRIERKEAHMAVLGARLLEDQKAGVEAAETVSLRHRGENSILASIADTVGRGLANALKWQVGWAGGDEAAVTVELNKDFIESAMSADAMVKMVAAWQQGGIGAKALFHNLQKGERLPPGMSFEDWRADVAERGAGEGDGEGDDDEAPAASSDRTKL